MIKKHFYLFFFLGVVFYFFSPFLLKSLLPIPSDTLVGLYHPFRDLYQKEYSRGVPFKNFLITDPIRQIIPWKHLSIDMLSVAQLPLWNPYEMTGKPLLGNFQASPFYPFNIFLFLTPFYASWSIFILLQLFLGGLFMWLYLSHLNLDKRAVLLGTLSWSFSGFFVAWLEWGTVIHTALWLPLILFSIDNIILAVKSNLSISKNKKLLYWCALYLFSLTFSFFAGHLQVFFYLFLFSLFYSFSRWIQFSKNKNFLMVWIVINVFCAIITAIQWIPTVQFIMLSARQVDQVPFDNPGWFIPFEHVVQFIVPDFFGNPTTLNYWGTWNYAEFIGYIGIIPLLFVFFAMFFRKDKKTLFFSVATVLAFIFALPSIVAKLPYILNTPFISTSQPTRLLFIICFSLAVLSALGFDFFIRNIKESYRVTLQHVFRILASFFLIFLILWIFTFIAQNFSVSAENSAVTRRNLLYPTIIFVLAGATFVSFLRVKSKRLRNVIFFVLIALTAFDLVRFASKFESFTNKEFFYPTTKSIAFLQKQKGPFRIASNDSRILAPNIATFYKIQSIEGYDPLYLRSYAELIAASERGKADIKPPFGFNRILTPHNVNSKIIDLLNVKYVLSLTEIKNTKFKKVFQEGDTRIYENKNVLPRAFFVENVAWLDNKQAIIEKMMNPAINFQQNAFLEKPIDNGWDLKNPIVGKVQIVEYRENKIVLKTQNSGSGFLVVTDSYYPTWYVTLSLDNNTENVYESKILKTNYQFRGVVVPKGNYTITMQASLF